MRRIIGLFIAICALSVSAKVVLPGIFSDHAVLAKNAKVPVFGKADPGEKVLVEFNKQKKETVAGKDGKWRVDLNLANSPEGPFELKINDIVIKDVIVGEVWLCSGQSNMAWVMKNTEGIDDAQKNPVGSRLRSFNVEKISEENPSDVIKGQWVYADAENVGTFSGVGYFFGKKLLNELKTPVGLINDAWGGSPIEAWMTVEAAKVVPEVAKRDLETSEKLRAYPARRKKYLADFDAWTKQNKRLDIPHNVPGPKAKWQKKSSVDVGYGVVWMRTYVENDTPGLNFRMPRQVVPFTVWIDGKKVFDWSFENAVLYLYPRFEIKDVPVGKHEVMFRIYNPVPGKRIFSSGNITIGKINTDGMNWDVFREKSFRGKTSPLPERVGATPRAFFNTQRLFNGCIYGMLPYSLDGVIWYQGETNAGRHKEYAALQRALIADWRKHFENPELPFYWCTLAGFRNKNAKAGAEESWAYLRAAQHAVLDMPFTGEAVLTDVCQTGDIHPRDKVIPGNRLAAIALANVYGKKVPFAGPEMTKVVREGNKLRISFKNLEGGLAAHKVPEYFWITKRTNRKAKLVRNSPAAQLEGFAVCGKDGKWFWADEAVIDGDTVVVSSKNVAEPAGVRFGWQNNPTVNLYNKAGFPAVPFQEKDVKSGGLFSFLGF